MDGAGPPHADGPLRGERTLGMQLDDLGVSEHGLRPAGARRGDRRVQSVDPGRGEGRGAGGVNTTLADDFVFGKRISRGQLTGDRSVLVEELAFLIDVPLRLPKEEDGDVYGD